MFLLVRQCAEPMTQLQRLKVKVTVKGHRIYPWFFCPPQIFWTLWKIFIKCWSNAYLIKSVCRALDSTTQTMGQDTPWISCLFHISGTFEKNSIKLDQMFIWMWQYEEPSPLSCYSFYNKMLHISDCLLVAGDYSCRSECTHVWFEVLGPSQQLWSCLDGQFT